MLTVPGLLAILIVTTPGATSWDCPLPCRCLDEVVDCAYRYLPHIEENMFNRTGAERIATLNLTNNRLTSLPDHIFDPLWGLKSLNLNHNSLKVLEVNLFSKLKGLEFLDMKGNMLSTLPVGLFALQNELISLDLSENQFSTLDIEVITPLMNLKTLLLSFNPLVCDCKFQPVVTWAIGKLSNMSAECDSPPNFKGLKWDEVRIVDCPSPPSALTTPSFVIYPSTHIPRTYTEASPPTRKPPGTKGNDFDVYPISIALIAVLIILTLVLIGTMVFIYCYKRLKGGNTHVQESCSE
jgi:hypothetical protein